MARLSNSVSIAITGGVPSWFSSLADKQWATPLNNATAIANNQHWLGASSVKPTGPAGTHTAIILSWTGMGADQSRKWIYMGRQGGHSEWHGNEVYSCDLMSESPQWTRRRNPSAGTATGTQTVMSDGRPVTDHTCSSHVSAEGRWFWCGTNALPNGSLSHNPWWEYSVASSAETISGGADDWINRGSGHANPSGALGVHGLALWDPIDRQILVFHDNNSSPSVEFQSIDNFGGSAALTNTNALNTASYIQGAIMPTQRIVVVRALDVYWWLKLTSNATKQSAWQSLSASGTAPSQTNAFHWHEASGAFLTWDSSTGLRKLTPTVNGSGNLTGLAWSAVAGAGGNAPTGGDETINGMFNKVQMIDDMGNGDSALIVVPRYAAPDVYVMRLSGGV